MSPVKKAKNVRTADELVEFLADTVALVESEPGSPPDAEKIEGIKTAIRKRFGFSGVEEEIKKAKKNDGIQGITEYVSDWVVRVLDARENKDKSSSVTADAKTWHPNLSWYDRNG